VLQQRVIINTYAASQPMSWSVVVGLIKHGASVLSNVIILDSVT